MLTSSTITWVDHRKRTPVTKEMTLWSISVIARVKCAKLEVIAILYGRYGRELCDTFVNGIGG